MASFSDIVRCTRCLEEVSYLPDPRILPCSHIYCTECLETISNTVDGGLELQCFQCGKTHQLNELSSLAVVQEDMACQNADLDQKEMPGPEESSAITEQDDNKAGSLMKCARCTDREAVCFCIECGERYCKLHEELHNNWYGNRHRFLSMNMYLARPNLYVKLQCTQHKKEFTLACRECLSLACVRCDTAETICKDGSVKHEFESLRGAETILRTQFTDILAMCSESLTYMGKKEKETWQSLDVLIDDCAKMKLQVQEKVKKQIKQIEDEGDRTIREITDYESRNTASVEAYLQDLRTKRDSLEAAIISCRQFLRDNHVSRIIKYRKEEAEKLERECMMDTRFGHQPYMLQDMGSQENPLLLGFVPKVMELEFIKEHDVGSKVCSICTDATGDGIYVAGTGITRYQKDMKVTATLKMDKWVFSAVSHGNFVYFIKEETSKWILMKSKCDLSNPSRITEFGYERLVAAFITITKGFLVVTLRHKSSIYLYNLETGCSNTIALKFAPRVTSNHIDGDLLITDTDGVLHKCSINYLNELQVVWSYSGLQEGYGVCTNDNGLIILTALRKDTMHVISPQGEMIQRFKDDRLREVAGDICNIKGVLYLPCWEKGKFLTFRLH